MKRKKRKDVLGRKRIDEERKKRKDVLGRKENR